MRWCYCNLSDFTPEEYKKAYACLSPSRKAHIDRFRKQEDRARSLAAELLVQKLLKEMGIKNGVLHRAENGQPRLEGCDLYVSITHCDKLVACAVSHEPVGIDAERIRPMDLNASRHVCVAEEKAYLLGDGAVFGEQPCSDPAVLRRFFEIWTAKEAYFKKQGTGITDLKSVNILTLDRHPFYVGDYIIQII